MATVNLVSTHHKPTACLNPITSLQPYSVPTVRRTLKSGLGDDLVQALGLSKTPGLEV